ncbi:uncharacterized protein KD926_004204 [Aspergillus affinis]|uniref:uncharacterized protein n=1 Tax=Aspergillus affinis TaxID=1070780 RepID=UPI0022FED3B2|nr:uncharacterized protein KD926_004204 [Aspergillus affinis]KAI9046364.1 hypothetical protein KD926_004204 [Aspergillus affinis]
MQSTTPSFTPLYQFHSHSIPSPPNITFFTPANHAGMSTLPTPTPPPTLFQPLRMRNLTLKNRIIVAPMCMYSCASDPKSPALGALTDYHVAHLGHLALKGVGMVIIEATAVQPNVRISPNDSGLWQPGTDSDQFRGLNRVVDLVHSQGAAVAVQLAHAGRKLSVVVPWLAMQAGKRTLRADAAGTEHGRGGGARPWREFLRPVTNRRTDRYGGSFENRTRIVREVIPEGMPLMLRISATEWLEHLLGDSWDLTSSIELAKLLPGMGIDFLDVSSGGNHRDQKIDMHNDYQVELSGHLRRAIRDAGQDTLVGTVGWITQAEQARDILQGVNPLADAVLMGRRSWMSR